MFEALNFFGRTSSFSKVRFTMRISLFGVESLSTVMGRDGLKTLIHNKMMLSASMDGVVAEIRHGADGVSERVAMAVGFGVTAGLMYLIFGTGLLSPNADVVQGVSNWCGFA